MHRLVKVVKCVSEAVVGEALDVVIGDSTDEPDVVPFRLDVLRMLELDETELVGAELVDVMLALTVVGLDEEGVMYADDELPGIVVTGSECVCTIAVPFSLHVVL